VGGHGDCFCGVGCGVDECSRGRRGAFWRGIGLYHSLWAACVYFGCHEWEGIFKNIENSNLERLIVASIEDNER